MSKTIIVKEDQNPEKNFLGVKKDIVKIASDKGVSVIEVIDELLEDLNNFRNPDYEKKVDSINISKSMPDSLLNSLKSYVIKLRKNVKEKESKGKKEGKISWKQIKEEINTSVLEGENVTEKTVIQDLVNDIRQGNSKYELTNKEEKSLLRKLSRRLDEINKEEAEEKNKIEQQKRNSEEAMIKIQEIVDREYQAGNVKDKASYLSSIREAILGKKEELKIDLKIEKATQELLIKKLDDRIKSEKDNLYFEQVEKFTKGFQFLREYPEIINAKYGARKINKFTDSESYERFCKLREKLQKEYDEHIGIDNIIKDKKKKIDDTDRRILLARKEVMDKEIEETR